MTDVKLSNLEKKKQELEQELARIQNGLDKSIDDVKEGVSDNMAPKNLIRKYPIPALGVSLIIGFLLGKQKDTHSHSFSSRNRSSDSEISRELKRIVAKKGISLLLDYFENKVAQLKENKKSADL